jgi:hypothetical protein
MVEENAAAAALPTALLLLLLSASACGKPEPNAPAQDFARRAECPASEIKTVKEPPNRMRVTGCGKTEYFVWTCGSSVPAAPTAEPHGPVTEEDARFSQVGAPPANAQGCAWSRDPTPAAEWRSTKE